MKRLATALMLALLLVLPTLAWAGASTDAALALGSFAVLNQIIGGTGLFAGLAPAPVYHAPPPPVYAPAPVYITPRPVVITPRPVYVAPRAVYVAPRPVYVAPRPVVVYKRTHVHHWHPRHHGGGAWHRHR